ncbi:hypothetical protein [Aeromonas veronii]|uniref:hypothetical protein n=1 Tax=Aeromonas veronii TaxID=654 RepID=UPI00039A8506|nr:hypothetical protein [Aeromonas veronii]
MKKIELIINPISFMLLGTCYYIVSPSIFFFNDYFGLDFIKSVVDKYTDYRSGAIYTHNIYDFIIINVSFSSGFLLISMCGSKVTENKVQSQKYGYLQLPILFFLVSVLLFVLIKAKITGYQFFSGYASYDVSVLGPLATLCFMSMWFYIFFGKKIFLVSFLIVGILLLGSGSRMFFLLPLISLLLSKLLRGQSNIIVYGFYFVLVAFFMLAVGLLREGSEISFDGLLTIGFAEPIFTSIGTLFYFEKGWPALGFPTDVIAAFVNFVPSVIYSDKQALMDSLTLDQNVFNPFGAQSLLINLYKNFGYFYPVFIFFLGSYFGFLFRYRFFNIIRTVYIMSLPLIVFHFQREGFITVFKVMFFNGLLFPILLTIFLSTVLKAKKG